MRVTNKDLDYRITNLEARMGTNKENIQTGNGLLEENKKTNVKVDKLEERLKKIEEWELATNYVVNDIKKALEDQTKAQLRLSQELHSIKNIFVKFGLSLFGYFILKEIGNWDLLNAFFDIIKKIF